MIVESSRRTESLFQLLIENALDLIVTLDLAGTFAYVSPSVRSVLGYEPDELVGTRCVDLLHPDDRQQRDGTLGDVASWDLAGSIVRVRRNDGTYAWLESNPRVLREPESGTPVEIVSVMRDVTDRVDAETALRRERHRLAEAQAVAHVGSWEWDVFTNLVSSSDELHRILGVGPGELDPTFDGFLECVHPDDREEVDAAIAHTLAQAGTFSIQHRIVRPDGSVRVLHSRGEATVDSGRRPIRLAGTAQDVTEHVQQELELARLAHIVESSEDAILSVTLDGTVLSWNGGAERLFGYAAGEIIGRPALPLVPEDLAAEREWFYERIGAGDSISAYDTVRQRKDGTLVDVAVTASPLRDGRGRIEAMSVIARNISQRRRAADALATRERQLRQLLDAAPDAIVIADAESRIVLVNARTETLFGYSRCEMVGQPVELLLPRRVWERDGDGGLELSARRKDGSEVAVEVTLSPLAIDDRQLVTAIARDVSERRRAEEQRQVLTERLAQSNRDLQDFAAIASHDLHEPLRKVRFLADRIEKRIGSLLDDDVRADVATMDAAVERMELLIDGLLEYAQVSMDASRLEDVDLSDVGREVLADLALRIEETRAQVELGELPTIDGRAAQLRQLFQNLVLNALKYHRPQEPPRLRINSRQLPDSSWEIRFEDEGIGFEAKHAKRIFGLFERLHGRSEYKGAGLGLAICRKIVERHSGTIEAHGVPGEGATFVVTLPAPRRPRTQPTVPPHALEDATSRVPARVLVVDDDQDDYEQTRRLLEETSRGPYETSWAASSEAAREALETGGHDVVLMDLRLDGADGLELIAGARGTGCEAAMLLFTGVASPALADRARDAGADGCLSKRSASAAELDAAISDAVDRRSR